jgi:hypothetical protein
MPAMKIQPYTDKQLEEYLPAKIPPWCWAPFLKATSLGAVLTLTDSDVHYRD